MHRQRQEAFCFSFSGSLSSSALSEECTSRNSSDNSSSRNRNVCHRTLALQPSCVSAGSTHERQNQPPLNCHAHGTMMLPIRCLSKDKVHGACPRKRDIAA
jgi:hypothetical protein